MTGYDLTPQNLATMATAGPSPLAYLLLYLLRASKKPDPGRAWSDVRIVMSPGFITIQAGDDDIHGEYDIAMASLAGGDQTSYEAKELDLCAMALAQYIHDKRSKKL